MRFREGVAGGGQAQGVLALRARARFGGNQVWSAVSYGYSSVDGHPTSQVLNTGLNAGPTGSTPLISDTTISRRVDVGQIGRAEAGLMTNYAGVEFSVGMSMERATRVTTQTMTVDGLNVPASRANTVGAMANSSTLRTVQRRDLATGIASVGFNTGATTWLLSVTAPVASWISADDLAPRPQSVPSVASLAVVQPVTGWLSLIGAAATNSATVGGSTLRDELRDRSRSNFSPVVAFGVRIARLPWRSEATGTPGGILSFETRTLGAVDSISVAEGALADKLAHDADTLRVVLLIDAPRAEAVELMGDATAWNAKPMRRLQNGRWRAELKLAPGVHRLIVRADGGQWIAPPGIPISNDEYGTPVGMIIVKSKH